MASLQVVTDTSVPSRRNPSLLTVHNTADNIERYLEADGPQAWGWVIYRSAYENESDWNIFLSSLRAGIEATLSFCGGLDLLASLDYKILEDPTFNGASTSTIREHFRTWTETAAQEDQGPDHGPAQSQRYQFGIQVDAEAVHSIIHDAVPPGSSYGEGEGWVKLIWKDWEPYIPDPIEEEGEPIEGVTLEDIGWSRTSYPCVIVETYCMIRSRNQWYCEYRRPPRVMPPP